MKYGILMLHVGATVKVTIGKRALLLSRVHLLREQEHSVLSQMFGAVIVKLLKGNLERIDVQPLSNVLVQENERFA